MQLRNDEILNIHVMKKVIVKNYFEKYDKLSKELAEGLENTKLKLSDKDKKEIANELKKASDIALRIIKSVKQ